jgi:lysozyme
MLGIEISKWNGDWDAARAKSAGAVFAFISSSQATIPDPAFLDNWSKAKEANLFRGACHYLDNTKPAQDQAACVIDLLTGDKGELPLAVRLESKSFENTEDLAFEYIKEFIDRVKVEGITPMIATSANSWPTTNSNSLNWAQYPLWVADCSSTETPQVPAPWKEWAFWKFTEKGDGETFGTESFDIHLNSFNGTLINLLNLINRTTTQTLEERILNLEQRLHNIDQFVSYLQAPISSPAAEKPEMDDELETAQVYAVCNANSLNVREGPGLSHQILGTVLYNQRVRVIDQQGGWVRIQEPEGWISEKYLGFE